MEGKLQCNRLVISALETDRDFEQLVRDAESILKSDDFQLITEILIVDENGIRRLRR